MGISRSKFISESAVGHGRNVKDASVRRSEIILASGRRQSTIPNPLRDGRAVGRSFGRWRRGRRAAIGRRTLVSVPGWRSVVVRALTPGRGQGSRGEP